MDNEKLREEFYNFLLKTSPSKDKTENIDMIADWWLSKFKDFNKQKGQKLKDRKFDESRLIHLWEKDSYKELRAYFLDCFERLITTPNPAYSQSEVDRLLSLREQELVQEIEKKAQGAEWVAKMMPNASVVLLSDIQKLLKSNLKGGVDNKNVV